MSSVRSFAQHGTSLFFTRPRSLPSRRFTVSNLNLPYTRLLSPNLENFLFHLLLEPFFLQPVTPSVKLEASALSFLHKISILSNNWPSNVIWDQQRALCGQTRLFPFHRSFPPLSGTFQRSSSSSSLSVVPFPQHEVSSTPAQKLWAFDISSSCVFCLGESRIFFTSFFLLLSASGTLCVCPSDFVLALSSH